MDVRDEIDPALRRRCEAFVCHEARLMDESRYGDWLKLWAPEALYWIPSNHDDIDPQKEISLVYEGLSKIRDRVTRLESKVAHAQSPKSRLTRVVSNFALESVRDGMIVLTSVFVLGEIRKDRQTAFFGRNRHVLVETEGKLLMREKKVLLLNNDATIGNMTFLI